MELPTTEALLRIINMKPAFIVLMLFTATCMAGLRFLTPIKKVASGGFTPADLTNLTLWYDLQDGTKVTVVSGKVSALTDKSTAANNASQGNASLRPVYDATSINGHPAMDGSSTTQLGLAMGSTAIRNPSSVFVVLKHGSNDGRGSIITKATNSYGAIYAVNAFLYSYALDTAGEMQSTTGTTASQGAVVEWDFATSNGASKMYIDNSALTLGTNNAWPAGSQASYTDLMGTGTVRSFDGSVGEIIICDSVTSQQRTNTYNYLKAKWGTP